MAEVHGSQRNRRQGGVRVIPLDELVFLKRSGGARVAFHAKEDCPVMKGGPTTRARRPAQEMAGRHPCSTCFPEEAS